MRKSLLGLGAACALLALTGAASAQQTVKVGLIALFSGGFAIWGEQFQRAVQAFQKVNGDSVKGVKVEVLYRDVGGPNPAKSKQLAEELMLARQDQVPDRLCIHAERAWRSPTW